MNLLTGTLPWIDAKSDDERLPTMCAHSGGTLCWGYDAVFAQFVDYTRNLAYDDTPDYQHWWGAFRRLVPGLPQTELPLFDPDDDSEPCVGVQKNPDHSPLPPCSSEDCPKPPPKLGDNDR